MAFGIEQADIGYDIQGMQKLINDINVNVIPQTTQTLRTSANNVRNAVEAMWQGASCEAFKNKLTDDTNTLCQTLIELAHDIESNLNQIGANIEGYDQSIAEKINNLE